MMARVGGSETRTGRTTETLLIGYLKGGEVEVRGWMSGVTCRCLSDFQVDLRLIFATGRFGGKEDFSWRWKPQLGNRVARSAKTKFC